MLPRESTTRLHPRGRSALVDFVLWVVVGYLLGSIPNAYFVARAVRGIDLRRYGSGTVSGTSVYYHVGPWAAVGVWVLDCLKGAVPTGLALRAGAGLTGALGSGLAAVAGHNWSLYLGLSGGRGLSAFVGMLFVVFPPGALAMLASFPLGRCANATAEANLLVLVALSLLIRRRRPTVAHACLGMLVLTLLKRAEANRLPLPAARGERCRVVARRLLMDRDTRSRDRWVRREP
jgi:acyl-phosphate glycerol 3-phosphate acyltransferase